MKICVKCGSQVGDDAIFCGKCGTPTAAQEPSETQKLHSTEEADPVEAPVRKKGLKIALAIGIPAVLLVIAAVVVGTLLLSEKPMDKFGRGLTLFFTDLPKIESNELSARMEKEPYDLSMTSDLSGLSKQLAGADGMLNGLIFSGGYKNNKAELGMRCSVSMGGIDLLNMAGMLQDDKLFVGMSSPQLTGSDKMNAAYLKLAGKAGDPLEERLGQLSTGSTNSESYKKLQEKLGKYFVESLDPKWFTNEQGEITDAITGEKVRTTAVTLTIGTKETIALIKSISEKLDKDPDFYNELDKLMKESGSEVNSKEEVHKVIDEMINTPTDEELKTVAIVHFVGAKPVAIECSSKLEGDSGYDIKALLQKNTLKGKAAYVFVLKGKSDSDGEFDTTFKLNIDKTVTGYDFDGNCVFGTEGQAMTLKLKGSITIEKKSSSKYDMNTKLNVGWVIPGTPESSIDLELKQTVGFGADILPIAEDSKYLYDQIKDNAKEVESLEELTKALSGNMIPTGILP